MADVKISQLPAATTPVSGTEELPLVQSGVTKKIALSDLSSISFGATGLTPATATSGAVVVAGTLDVNNGGTGLATLTANNVILGNGTSTPTFVAPSTSGKVLTSNGTTWVSSVPATSGTVTSVNVSGGTTGLTTSGGPITTSGVITLAGTLDVDNGGTGLTAGTSGGVLAYTAAGTLASSAALTQYGVVYGGGAGAVPVATAAGTTGQVLTATTSGAPSWAAPATSGTVTSVAMTVPSVLSISGSPITSSGTLALTYSGTALPVANGGTGVTTSTGTTNVVLSNSPTLVTPNLGSPNSVGTMPAFTLGGTVSGGGNQINNVVIGNSSPLAGAFTTLSATGTITSTVAQIVLTNNDATYEPAKWISIGNKGGLNYFGADNITGTTLGTGLAYSAVIYGATGVTQVVAGSPITKATSTGLAVTGTLSATGTLSGGTSGTAYSFSGSAPATSLTLDASGQLGIGTSSPSQKLHVASATNAQGLFKTTGAGGGSNRSSVILESPSNTWYINTNGSDLNGTDGALGFYGNSATRMVIDTSGNLLVGTTSASFGGRVIVSNDGTATQTSLSCINTLGSGTMRQIDFFTGTNTSRIGSIESTTTLTSYNVTSDYRLKENIAPMTGALAKIAQLKPVTYKWKINGSDGQGFIAHELAEVVPDCVSGEKDAVNAKGNPEYQGIDVSFLVATLTAAIQEQQALITQLTARITALETA